MQIESNSIEVPPLASCQFPEIPPQAVGPVDQVQMADVVQRAIVLAPFRAFDADEAVVGPFRCFHDVVRFAEDGCQVWVERGTVAEVADVGVVWCSGVE